MFAVDCSHLFSSFTLTIKQKLSSVKSEKRKKMEFEKMISFIFRLFILFISLIDIQSGND